MWSAASGGRPGARADAPEGATLTPVYDQATLVEESMANVRDAILVGIGLCFLVITALPPRRAGRADALLSVPVTLSITFLFMRLAHQTLNLMSLGGMAVAIGLVIDDAIVIVEAIAYTRAWASARATPRPTARSSSRPR